MLRDMQSKRQQYHGAKCTLIDSLVQLYIYMYRCVWVLKCKELRGCNVKTKSAKSKEISSREMNYHELK